jgi:hypothetical protein
MPGRQREKTVNKEMFDALPSESRQFVEAYNEARRTWRIRKLSEKEKTVCKQFANLLGEVTAGTNSK